MSRQPERGPSPRLRPGLAELEGRRRAGESGTTRKSPPLGRGQKPKVIRRTVALSLLVLASCASYEYEEEIFLEVDGSGRFRVSGSAEALESIHGLEKADAAVMERYFEDPSVALASVRENEKNGRRFVHVQGRFSHWSDVCRHPAFAERGCGLIETQDGLKLRFSLPPLSRPPPDSSDEEAILAVRFHIPSTVTYHNAARGIERGNILRWERPLWSHSGEEPLEITVEFDRRSVLSATVRILVLALSTVVVAILVAVGAMVRKGRRELAQEVRRPEP